MEYNSISNKLSQLFSSSAISHTWNIQMGGLSGISKYDFYDHIEASPILIANSMLSEVFAYGEDDGFSQRIIL